MDADEIVWIDPLTGEVWTVRDVEEMRAWYKALEDE